MSAFRIPTQVRLALSLLVPAGLTPNVVAAQIGYRLRLDGGAQTVAFRGVTLDSIAVTDTVGTPGQGPTTSDGYAVQCLAGAPATFGHGDTFQHHGQFHVFLCR